MGGAQVAFLPDGRRLHLHHGPIDLIIGAEGPGRRGAFERAAARFDGVLDGLVAELDLLRRPVGVDRPQGRVARAMWAAVRPFAPAFVTPMAAVAGAVADEIMRAARAGAGVHRIHVNNGGDIAFFLAAGQSLTAAIADGSGDRVVISEAMAPRGLATSGWRGRSHSLGIADSVTVLAADAARADAAATMIANRVDLPGHRAITRRPACEIAPDSDLGALRVTVAVGPLTRDETAAALARGADHAADLLARGLIDAARLTLNDQRRTVGAPLFPGMPKEVHHA